MFDTFDTYVHMVRTKDGLPSLVCSRQSGTATTRLEDVTCIDCLLRELAQAISRAESEKEQAEARHKRYQEIRAEHRATVLKLRRETERSDALKAKLELMCAKLDAERQHAEQVYSELQAAMEENERLRENSRNLAARAEASRASYEECHRELLRARRQLIDTRKR